MKSNIPEIKKKPEPVKPVKPADNSTAFYPAVKRPKNC